MIIDNSNFESLFKTYYNSALNLAFLITNDAALSNDIVQDAFMIVYEKLYTLREKEKFKYWLNKIVINCSNKAIKRNSKYYLVENTNYICDKMPYEYKDPLSIIEIEERQKLLYTALSSLGDLERQVFILRYYEEYSFREIVTATSLCPQIDGFKCRLTDGNPGHTSIA